MKTGLGRIGKKVCILLLAASLIIFVCYLILLQKSFLEADVFGRFAMYMLASSSALRLLASFSEERTPRVIIRIPMYRLSNPISAAARRVLGGSEKARILSKKIRMLKPTITISKFKFNDEYVILINTDKDLARAMGMLNRIIPKYSGGVRDLKSVLILKNNSKQDGLNLLIVREEGDSSEFFEDSIKVTILGIEGLRRMLQDRGQALSESIVLYGEEFVKTIVKDMDRNNSPRGAQDA